MNKQRESTFDIFKLGAVFLVILLHTNNQSRIGQYIAVITRIAVPIFFLISGYFYDTLSPEKKHNQLIKILKLVLFTNVGYFVWDILYALITGDNPLAFITTSCTLQNLILFLVVNESPFATHLWYLSSILYVLFILKLCEKPVSKKVLYILTPFLLIAALLLGNYSYALFKIRVYYIFTRNFLFTGLPFVCLGRMLYSKRDFIQNKVNTFVILAFVVFGIVCGLCEKYLIDSHYFLTYGDLYIGTIILSVSLICLGIKHPFIGENSVFSKWGRQQTVNIFIFHQVFNYFFNYIADIFGFYSTYIVFSSVVVFVVTLAFSLLFSFIMKKIQSSIIHKVDKK